MLSVDANRGRHGRRVGREVRRRRYVRRDERDMDMVVVFALCCAI